ncbi:MAG: hypothetical protein II574_00190 [Ruminococcus sp.]|nr:hypothetical protein [Ruminococcus sp.]
MLVLMLKTLRYHTFNKFFFIAAVMLFFCGSRDAQYKSGSSSVTVLAYGILFVIGTVFLNINNENRSGGYRNALTAGFTKRQVFFAHIISSAVCGAALFLFIAFPIYTSLRSSKTFMAILMIYILSAVVTACIHLNITNVTAAFAVVAIVVVLCIVVTKPAQDMLGEDRYYYDVVFDESKVETEGIDAAHVETVTPNPDYPTGVKRAVLKTFAYADPYSQLVYSRMVLSEQGYINMLTDPDDINRIVYYEYWCFPLVTTGVISAVSILGYVFYRKKDLY